MNDAVTHFEPQWTFGPVPEGVDPVALALETGVSEDDANAMIEAAWVQVETFTGRTYRDMTSGRVIIKVSSPITWVWPRYPFPEELTIECLANGTWMPWQETYIAVLGMIELEPGSLYRLSHLTTTPGAIAGPHVRQAVWNLAAYQIIQNPLRREFRSQSAGDSSLTREALMGVMYGSGAGALLAGEVRI